ncbi:MAG: DEAD/DEAH box helicase [Candidatus Sericytochromatia bacterium]|nr:DEAD/DEAH box helicase [Candidatus Sericytochromatia bacterium]
MKFADFDLKPELLQALEEMGYTAPTPIQEQTIPTLLQGGDVIGCAQTGTGKTAAFALPVLQRINPGATAHPQALIITPTRELAEQIFKSIQDYTRFMPVRCVAVYGGVPSRGQEAALKKGVDIVVATPGRLLDLLQKPSLRLYDVRFLILDEADRMLDMGFIPDVENIVSYVPRTRQTLLFSATMPPEIEKLARKVTRTQSAEMIVVGERSSSADTVTQWICKVGDRDKMPLLIQLLKNAEMVSTIIFTRTKLGCAELSRRLDDAGISAMAIHSNLTQTQRQNALDRFKRGECRILVATDIAARGLDIEKVSHVINFDTPTHPEDYVHRVGRTGRALAKGEAFTFVAPAEIRHLKNIERLIRKELPEFKSEVFAQVENAPEQSEQKERAERTHSKTRPERSKTDVRKSQTDKNERPSPERTRGERVRTKVEPTARRKAERSPAESHSESQQVKAKPQASENAHGKRFVSKPLESVETPLNTQPVRKAPHHRRSAKVAETATQALEVRSAEIETPFPVERSQKNHVREKPQNERSSQRSSRTVRAAKPVDQPDLELELPGQEKPIQHTRSHRNADKPRSEPTRTGFVPRSAQSQTASAPHHSSKQLPVDAHNDDMSIAVAKPKTGGYTPRPVSHIAAAPNKPSHSAKMSKNAQPGSPTSSRFYRHDDDVDWIEED